MCKNRDGWNSLSGQGIVSAHWPWRRQSGRVDSISRGCKNTYLVWPFLLSPCPLPSLVTKPIGHQLLVSIKLSEEQNHRCVGHRNSSSQAKDSIMTSAVFQSQVHGSGGPYRPHLVEADRTTPWLASGCGTMMHYTLPRPQPVSRANDPNCFRHHD